MGTRTRKQLEREHFLKLYFHHWKLQNDPEYIKLWKRWEIYLEKYKNHLEKSPLEMFEPDKSVHADWENLQKKFGVLPGSVLPHPFKKIDWEGLVDSNRVDQEVLMSLASSSPSPPVQWHSCRESDQRTFSNPILSLDIDLRHDKKDILEGVSMQIDMCRRFGDIDQSTQRDHINKFHIYAQVWDLRKGFPKKSISEIARELRRPIPTVKSQFKKAYELLTGRPYIREDYKKLRGSTLKKRICDKCPERPCEDPFHCPDLLLQLEEIEGKQQERLGKIFFDKYGEEKSTYELASNREAVRKWQEESQ
jgi:hypothetical protein